LTKITDSLVELFIQLVHRINARAERWADKEMIAEFRRVRNKEHAVVEVIVVLRNRSRGGGWPAELDRDSKRRSGHHLGGSRRWIRSCRRGPGSGHRAGVAHVAVGTVRGGRGVDRGGRRVAAVGDQHPGPVWPPGLVTRRNL
jgi:hypothetical protein